MFLTTPWLGTKTTAAGASQGTRGLGADGAYGVFTIDINHDGLLDILSASRDAEELAIHTQMRAHSINVDLGASIVISGALLRAFDPDDGPSELTYAITASPMSGMLELGGTALSPEIRSRSRTLTTVC